MTISAQAADPETISGQLLLASRAHDTASATARRTASEHAKEAWHHELRNERGEWVHGNDALTAAATGRHASAIRVHDHLLYGKTVRDPSGFGYATDIRPMEVISVRHHYEGHGKTPGGRPRRTRFTDTVVRDPETGEEHEQSMKDNSSVKLFPREVVKSGQPKAKTAPGDWVHGPLMTLGPRPGDEAPAQQARAAPPASVPVLPPEPAPAARPAGRISKKITADAAAFPDPETRQKALAETQHALDIQMSLIPHTAGRMKIAYGDPAKMGRAMGLSGGIFSPKISDAGTGGLASKDAARYRADGFWAKADSSHTMADTVIAHETGHTLLPGAAAYNMELWTGLAKALGLSPPSQGWPSGNAKYKDFADVDSWIKDNKSAVEAAVSRYGASNSAEMMAEMWSEYTMSSSPRPAAQMYGDYVMSVLGEKA